MSFAAHGSSELSLTGAAFALLTARTWGMGALVGSALAAVLFGILGQRARERDSAIGAVLAFGLGMAVLFIHLYPGRTGTSFALLTGQIVGVGYSGLVLLVIVAVVVMAVLAVSYRPLLFATADPDGGCPRSAGARIGHRVRRTGRCRGSPGRSDRRSPLVMSLLITPPPRPLGCFRSPTATIVVHRLRRGVRRRRNCPVAGTGRSGLGVRDDDLVRHLSDLLGAQPPLPRGGARGVRLSVCVARLERHFAFRLRRSSDRVTDMVAQRWANVAHPTDPPSHQTHPTALQY